MKLKVRNSKSKKAKMTGFRTRQKTAGGRKVNKRQRARHGSIYTTPATPSGVGSQTLIREPYLGSFVVSAPPERRRRPTQAP